MAVAWAGPAAPHPSCDGWRSLPVERVAWSAEGLARKCSRTHQARPSGVGVALTGAVAGASVAAARRARRRGRRLAAESVPVAAETPVPVWVINLDKSADRWDSCRAGLQERGVTTAERFPATYGKELPQDELLKLTTWGARQFLTPGMIGCFISHLRAWKRVVDEDLPAAVVLEDDARVFEGFNGRLAQLLEELPEDWDVCLLGAVGCIARERQPFFSKLYGLCCGGWRRSPGKTRGVSENLYVPFKPAGTHAYMVSRRGAAKLAERLPRARYHVDLSAWSLQDLNLYAAKDFLATQNFEEVSTVSKDRESRTQSFLNWTVQVSGMSKMIAESGAPMEWAWKVVLFTLPLPFTGRKVLVSLGPAYAVFVLIAILGMIRRSPLILAISLTYQAMIVFMMRWLSGTFTARTALLYALAVSALYYLALA